MVRLGSGDLYLLNLLVLVVLLNTYLTYVFLCLFGLHIISEVSETYMHTFPCGMVEHGYQVNK